MRTLSLVAMFFLVMGCDRAARPRQQAAARHQAYVCADHVPKNSTGRKPAGTRSDPFVGHAVVRFKHVHTPGLVEVLARQKPIPYFRTGVEAWFSVPEAAAAGVREGDLVLMKYALLPNDSDLAKKVAAVEESAALGHTTSFAGRTMPFVYCGFELFAIEVLPDPEVHRS